MTRLELFVPGRLTNPLNVAGLGLWKHRRWAKDWRDRTSTACLIAKLTKRAEWSAPSAPKRIVFAAQTWNALDDDNLRAALKPVRDGLVDARVIDDDSPRSGHAFAYTQRIDRKRGGVWVTVADREDAPCPGP